MVGITGVKGSAVLRIRQNAFNTVFENPSNCRIFSQYYFSRRFLVILVSLRLALFSNFYFYSNLEKFVKNCFHSILRFFNIIFQIFFNRKFPKINSEQNSTFSRCCQISIKSCGSKIRFMFKLLGQCFNRNKNSNLGQKRNFEIS